MIREVENGSADVFFLSLQTNVVVPLTSLRPDFVLRDMVEVMAGKYKKSWGWIVRMVDNEVELFVPGTTDARHDPEQASTFISQGQI